MCTVKVSIITGVSLITFGRGTTLLSTAAVSERVSLKIWKTRHKVSVNCWDT